MAQEHRKPVKVVVTRHPPSFHSPEVRVTVASEHAGYFEGTYRTFGSFKMVETQKFLVDAILFDMDGTLIDSTPGVYKAWELFSKDYSLGESTKIVHETHGRRLYDTLKEYCKITEETKLHEEIDRFENEVILGGPVALPGAVDLLSRLNTIDAKWTIVTSASNKYTPGALSVAGVPLPSAEIVTSNDVTKGKPHPDPYLAGALKCRVDARNCLVVEDAVSGLNAGRAAGAKVLAVCTSTPKERLLEGSQPHFIVPDLRSVSVSMVGDKIEVTIAPWACRRTRSLCATSA